jgi:hypothetical protein
MQTNKSLTLNTQTSEPRRGDGIPWQPSKKGFNKKKDFEPVIHDQLINEFRSIDKEDELEDYYKPKQQAFVVPKSLDGLLKPARKGVFAQKYQGGKSLCWMSGFWCAQLQIKDKVGYELKFPAWSLAVLVGTTYKTDANTIRTAIIKVHAESGYNMWKRTVTEDLKGRIAALDAIANYLGQKKKVAFSYVYSSSSKRLLKSMGIEVHSNHAMIYPHYKGNWAMKVNPYQTAETTR